MARKMLRTQGGIFWEAQYVKKITYGEIKIKMFQDLGWFFFTLLLFCKDGIELSEYNENRLDFFIKIEQNCQHSKMKNS